MDKMEKASLDHAAEWLRYERSIQSRNDLLVDKQRRERLDLKLGHSPKCGILKCHPECTRTK